MKQYKLLTLLNVGPWMYIIFYTLFDEMGSMQKVPLLHTEVWCLSQKEALRWLFELWAKLATFFTEHHFLLESVKNHVYLDLGIWQTVSQQWTNETITSRKTTDSFVSKDKIQALRWKLEF